MGGSVNDSNCLENCFPEIAKQWHPSKNENKTPKNIMSGSAKKIWWLCPNKCEYGCVHEWECVVVSRTKLKSGCPYCAKYQQKICYHQSLKFKYPEIALEWHPTDNGNLIPDNITCGSDKKIWWLCKNNECNQKWQTSVKHRTLNKSGCPYCNHTFGRQKVLPSKTFLATHPEIAKEWHPSKNGELKPENFTYGSTDKIWWLCPKKCEYGCLHEYEQAICNRTKGNCCPYCCDNGAKKICYHQSLAFKYPVIASEWHPTKNNLNPEEILPLSGNKVWWLCPKKCEYGCLHEYEQVIANKVNGDGCPYCAKNASKVCVHNSFEFKYPEIIKELHPTKNENIKLSEYAINSNKKIWWLCSKKCEYGCLHEYEQRIVDKSYGSGCPYCLAYGNAKQFCYHETVEYKYPDLINEWHPNNKIKPNEITSGSSIKVWWKCIKNNNHEWESVISNRCNLNSGCPYCYTKFSKISLQWLEYIKLTNNIQYGSIETGGEFRIPNTRYAADGFCKETNTIYEFHGDMWHGNPNNIKYPKDNINPITKTTYGELYEKTQKKKRDILELGYNYVEMWEYDWIRAIKAVIKIQRLWRNKLKL